ncbi:hypothetical protein EIP86_007732 [Pleurotus ostreatoroseus]|nr:hypothetical protein EIP86_007732 [Pleurotus ostreatoroseus]
MSRIGTDSFDPASTPTQEPAAATGVAQPPPPMPQPHPQFWFEDGNVIIVVGNTKFRVHQSFLARKSPVFRSMLASHTEVTPTLHLCYNENKFARFLGMLYNDVVIHDQYYPGLELVSIMVYFSKKYKVKQYEDIARAHLSRLAPVDLFEWSDYNCPGTLVRTQEQRRIPCIRDLRWDRDCIAVANLARRLGGMSRLHCTALYHCVQLSDQLLLHGFSSDNKLSSEDRLRCVQARDKLLRASYMVFHDIFIRIPELQCQTREACKAACQRSRSHMATDTTGYWVTTRPLTASKECEWLLNSELGLCWVCKASAFGQLKRLKQNMLDNLETYFLLQ